MIYIVCLSQKWSLRILSVETDPAAGMLSGATTGAPVDIGGTTLPGIVVDGPGHHRLVPVAR